jgi:hypothetical protein
VGVCDVCIDMRGKRNARPGARLGNFRLSNEALRWKLDIYVILK